MKKPTLIILIICSILTAGIIVFGLLVILNQIESMDPYLGVFILGFGPTILIWGPLLSWGILKAKEKRKQKLPIMKKPTRIVLVISIILFLILGLFSGLSWILIGDSFAAGITSFSLAGAAGGVLIILPLITYLFMRRGSVDVNNQ